jgi:hypothetical protein
MLTAAPKSIVTEVPAPWVAEAYSVVSRPSKRLAGRKEPLNKLEAETETGRVTTVAEAALASRAEKRQVRAAKRVMAF